MTSNFLLLVTVTLIGLGTAVKFLVETYLSLRTSQLKHKLKRLAEVDQINITKFRLDCTKIGIVYDPADGYPVKVSLKLRRFVKREHLQLELGCIIGKLLIKPSLNGNAGRVAILLETEALLSKDQQSFWSGFGQVNPELFWWHAYLRQLYNWNHFV